MDTGLRATAMQAALYVLFSPSWVFSMSILASDAGEDDVSLEDVSQCLGIVGLRSERAECCNLLCCLIACGVFYRSPISSPSSQQSSQPVLKSTTRNGYRPYSRKKSCHTNDYEAAGGLSCLPSPCPSPYGVPTDGRSAVRRTLSP
ncbi:hypothetical protein BV25DRAFT_250830 [Artomyces pyxidatus]|uniref:Uncharacterized protein n=1 Tax=Artomyces pyxidatus TaxID=48021 RepID=A0ACB8T708_9AGAM|nr:hypothetical protein BV25DRAFT_250830 [Artomyces pyxidatus]